MDTLQAVSSSPYPEPEFVAPKKSVEAEGSIKAATKTPAPIQALPESQNTDNKQQITNAVKDINHFFQMAQRSLEFTIDEASGHMVMQIKDTQTNEVIRQIPGEDALKLAKQLDDVKGVLFKANA